jgi:EpsI family protein
MMRWRLLILTGLLLLILLGSHLSRRIECASLVHDDFLRTLQLPFRDWNATDLAIPSSDLRLLEPDATLMRQYSGPNGQWAQLAIIAGHRKKSIHTPGFCMAGGGWDVVSQRCSVLTLTDRKIPTIAMVVSKDGRQSLVTYFFTDGDYSTNSLIEFQAAQLLKRFKARIPLGALVRIIVPIATSETEAQMITTEFAKSTLPMEMSTLRQTCLDVHPN